MGNADWRSRFFVVVLLIAGLMVLYKIGEKSADFSFSVVITTILYAHCATLLRKGAWRALWATMSHWFLCFWFILFGLGAFTYTTIISGGYSTKDLVPYACYGSIHMHHWLQGLIGFTAILHILKCMANKQDIQARRVALTIGLILCALAVLCFYHLLPGNNSLVIVLSIYGLFFFLLGWLIRFGNSSSREFKLIIGIGLGMLLGIHLNGIRDFVIGKTSESLIFRNDDRCLP